MSGYAALAGFAGSLGEHLNTMSKQQLLERLEADKEARDERRDVRREERAETRRAKEVKETRIEDTGGGRWMRRSFNANGDLLKEEPASASDVKSATNAAEKERLSLEAAAMKAEKDRKDLANYDEDRALDLEYRRSQIDRNKADAAFDLGTGRQTGKSGTAKGGSFEDTVDEFVKDNKGLFDQYVKGSDEDDQKFMNASEFRDVARQAVKAAAQRNMDPRSFFADHLRRYVNDKRSSYGRTRSLDQ